MDLIDRNDAINALMERFKRVPTNAIIAKDVIENLPSAQPKPQEGKWIPVHPIQSDDPGAYMCSVCKTGMWEIRPSSYHYCPNCGAYMKGDTT